MPIKKNITPEETIMLKKSLIKEAESCSDINADFTMINVTGGSSKFYQIARDGDEVTTCYGKIGYGGTMSTKTYHTVDEAERVVNKTLREKIAKGYETKEDIMGIKTSKVSRKPKKLSEEGLAKLDIFLTLLKH